jgi:hypothetical protein
MLRMVIMMLMIMMMMPGMCCLSVRCNMCCDPFPRLAVM